MATSPLASPSERTHIAVSPKSVRRFYYPIVLLSCLTKACLEKGETQAADRVPSSPIESYFPEPSRDALDDHCTFVNKLAQVCDSKPAGDTVTAFMILVEPSGVVYNFASNSRTEAEIEETASLIRSLLSRVKNGGNVSQKVLRDAVLLDVLGFNYERIRTYVNGLAQQLRSCIPLCAGDSSDESRKLEEILTNLQGATQEVMGLAPRSHEFTRGVAGMIKSIEALKLRNFQLLEKRVPRDQVFQPSVWSELVHFIGRLASYNQAATVIVKAKDKWPDLFDSFTVQGIPSSAWIRQPLKSTITANEIIGTATSADDVARYRSHMDQLQKFGVDGRLQSICKDRGVETRVHCEVLLLDWIQNSPGGIRPDRFFRGVKYIGSSKPTCRLCELFFQSCPSKMRTRPGHGNLYHSWRMPDCYEDQGPEAARRWRAVQQQVLSGIRAQLLHTVIEKVPVAKKHDSDTNSYLPSGLRLSLLTSSARGPGSERDDATNAAAGNIDSGDGGMALLLSRLTLVDEQTGMRIPLSGLNDGRWRLEGPESLGVDEGSSVMGDWRSQLGDIDDGGSLANGNGGRP